MKRGAYQIRGSVLPTTQAARAPGEVLRIDLHEKSSKTDLMLAVADQLDLPSWFGANWDALADSLSDRLGGTVVFERCDDLDSPTADGLASVLAALVDKDHGPEVTVVCRGRRLKQLTIWPRL